MHLSDYAQSVSRSFAMPDTCQKIKALADDPTSTVDDYAKVIGVDPSLSSKLLKLANSALFRFPAQISTISKAVSVIGGEAIYNLALMEMASATFTQLESQAIDLKRFWQHSVFSGLVAKNLAKMLKFRGTERFFLLGLIHNLGELAVANQTPEVATAIEAQSQGADDWKVQRQHLGFTYTAITAQVLRDWQLPKDIWFPIYSLDEESTSEKQDDAMLLRLSARAANFVLADSEAEVIQALEPHMLERLELDQDELFDALKFARLEGQKLLHLMNPKLFT